MNSRIRRPLYISFKSWLCCCSLPSVAPQQLKTILTFLAMHSGKSVFNLCGTHHILAIKSLQQGKNHGQKLRWPSFLMSRLTNLPLIAWRLPHRVELGRDVIHHPPDGLSDCTRSSVLWATSAHLSLPGLNDVLGTLQTVEIELLAKLGSY